MGDVLNIGKLINGEGLAPRITKYVCVFVNNRAVSNNKILITCRRKLWIIEIFWNDIEICINTLKPEHNRRNSWRRHQMETFSALLALCEGNSPVTCKFPSQRPMTRMFSLTFITLFIDVNYIIYIYQFHIRQVSTQLCKCRIDSSALSRDVNKSHFDLTEKSTNDL